MLDKLQIMRQSTNRIECSLTVDGISASRFKKNHSRASHITETFTKLVNQRLKRAYLKKLVTLNIVKIRGTTRMTRFCYPVNTYQSSTTTIVKALKYASKQKKLKQAIARGRRRYIHQPIQSPL